MSVDKFGRTQYAKNKIVRGPPGPPGPPGLSGVGFKYTANGHFDITNKRLTNVLFPVRDSDVVTKGYLNSFRLELLKEIRQFTIEETDFNFDFKNKRLANVAPAKNDNDVVTRTFVVDYVQKLLTRIGEIESQIELVDEFLARLALFGEDPNMLKDDAKKGGRKK